VIPGLRVLDGVFDTDTNVDDDSDSDEVMDALCDIVGDCEALSDNVGVIETERLIVPETLPLSDSDDVSEGDCDHDLLPVTDTVCVREPIAVPVCVREPVRVREPVAVPVRLLELANDRLGVRVSLRVWVGDRVIVGVTDG
jgi:hypothetical protein